MRGVLHTIGRTTFSGDNEELLWRHGHLAQRYLPSLMTSSRRFPPRCDLTPRNIKTPASGPPLLLGSFLGRNDLMRVSKLSIPWSLRPPLLFFGNLVPRRSHPPWPLEFVCVRGNHNRFKSFGYAALLFFKPPSFFQHFGMRAIIRY